MATVQEIKATVESQGSYFFSRDTLKFFGQTTRSFKVKTSPEGRVFVYAPSYDGQRLMGYTFREFVDNDLVFAHLDSGEWWEHFKPSSAKEIKTYIATH